MHSTDKIKPTRPKAPAYTIRVDVGGGAKMSIVNPWSDPHVEWMLRYAVDLNPWQAGRMSAASILDSYDYLLSSNISMTEATRRLRILRKARAQPKATP